MKPQSQAPPREVNKFKQLARRVIEHHLGAKQRRIVYKSSGLTNFVFAIKNSAGDFVVRISPEPSRINSFIKEQWAQKAARKAGIPVPEILEVGSEVIPYPYMISHEVTGSEATHHPRRLEILRDMGLYAAKINSIKTNGFGQTFDWSENQLSLNASFKDYLENEYRFQEKLHTLEKHRMLSTTQARYLRKIFAAAAKLRPKPVLNHGDIRLKNVIADTEGKINAIIDWEGATSNIAPQWELSIALHDLGIDGMQHFLEGYGIRNDKLKEMMPLVKAFNVANYASAIEDIIRSKNKTLMEQYRTRLSGALDLYSF